eukprot:TRINITY_DN25826_c0_g1_i2.p1 TRINITY_DN25826_c0_g1~~TRINITY_DN25826_c0_g1_i2.p1  ORF type:complete len:657 (+),score=191.17 TRINITY_DN25826_c0_g1_i2:104-2074(+)
MVSLAERRAAAKEKLAAIDARRKERKTAQEHPKKEAKQEVGAVDAGGANAVPEKTGQKKLTKYQKLKARKKLQKQNKQSELGTPEEPQKDEKVSTQSRPEKSTPKAEKEPRPDNRKPKTEKAPGEKKEKKWKKRPLVPLVPTSAPAAMGAAAYRETHNIMCKNMECPAPLETFEASEELLGSHFVQALRERDFLAPSPIQAQTWPLALSGHDVVAIAQTGSGKTLAYLLPALVRLQKQGKPSTTGEPARPRVLVLAPTRELVTQIATDVSKLAISISHRFVPCFGGVLKSKQLNQLAKGCDILISTPGRLREFMCGDKAQSKPAAVKVADVSYLVIDEADAMLAMGFIPQVRDIVRRCLQTGSAEEAFGAAGPKAGTARQTLFFTATWPVKVRAAAKEFASAQAAQLRIGQGVGKDKLTANQNVRQIVQVVEYMDKLTRLTNVLTSELKPGDTALVFCGTKGRVEYVVDMLNQDEIVDWCEGIHSGKEQWVRDTSLQHFRQHTAKRDRRAVLVATDVAARGIDIPGVALVVVYDLNGWNGELSIDSYVHRIGRTGRNSTAGRAFTFVESKDRGIPALVKLLEDAGQHIPKPLRELEADERVPRKERKEAADSDELTLEGAKALKKARAHEDLRKGKKRLASEATGQGKLKKQRHAA